MFCLQRSFLRLSPDFIFRFSFRFFSLSVSPFFSSFDYNFFLIFFTQYVFLPCSFILFSFLPSYRIKLNLFSDASAPPVWNSHIICPIFSTKWHCKIQINLIEHAYMHCYHAYTRWQMHTTSKINTGKSKCAHYL